MSFGGIWLLVGLLWLMYLTKGFRRQPPEMHLADDEIPEEREKSPAP